MSDVAPLTANFEISLELNAPLERVWAVLIDLPNTPRWHPVWRAVTLTETARQGTAFGLSGPLPGNAWVTRCEAPSLLEILYFPHLTGLREEMRFRLRSLGSDRTHVTYAVNTSGLIAPLFAGRARTQAARVLAGLERAVRELSQGRYA